MSEFYGKMSGNGGKTEVTRAGHKTNGIYTMLTDSDDNSLWAELRHDPYDNVTEVRVELNGDAILSGPLSWSLKDISPYFKDKIDQERHSVRVKESRIKQLEEAKPPAPEIVYHNALYFIKQEVRRALKNELGALGEQSADRINERIKYYVEHELKMEDNSDEEPTEEVKEKVDKGGLEALFG